MTDIAQGSSQVGPARTADLRGSIVSARVPDQDDLLGILKWCWRGKWIALGCAALGFLLAMLYLSQVTPLYTAEATMMLDTREKNVVDVDTVLSGLNRGQLSSEIEVIRSSQLLGRVVDKLDLLNDPEFNGRLANPGSGGGIKAAARALLIDLGLAERPKPESGQRSAEANHNIRAAVIGAVRGRLFVEQVNRSLIMQLTFTSPDPRKAALMANAIADQYLNDQLEVKYEATRRASSWLTERLDELKTQVEASEAAVEDFKAGRVAADGQGAGLTTQQMNQLNSELISARASRAEAEARYNQLASRLQDGNPLAVAEVLTSPSVQRLRETESELRRQEAELSSRYLERHPKLIKVRAEIADVENNLVNEIQKVVENLRGELAVTRSREGTLASNLRVVERRVVNQNQASIGLRQLEREAEANRTIYENFLSRFKETAQQEDIQDADVRVISRAELPGAPSSPKRLLVLSGATALGLMLGFGLVILREVSNNTIRSPKDIEALFGLPTLGNIPLLKRGLKGRRNVFAYVGSKPTSAIAEACRSLRTAMLLSDVDKPPQVVMVTSSVPGEGKSTLALMLAQTSVSLGKKVLVIDCDLRRSTVHTTIGVPNEPSLVDVLSGAAESDAAIHHDPISGLDILPSKPTNASTVDLLSSKRFNDLIDQFRGKYDSIFLDTAPVLAVSDALVVGNLADLIIYVVKWDDTPKQEISSGLQTLSASHLKIGGIALNQIDARKADIYGVEGAYYGRYTEYYQK